MNSLHVDRDWHSSIVNQNRSRGDPPVPLPIYGVIPEMSRLELVLALLARARAGWHYVGMRTVFEAAGGIDGLQRLAAAWHSRVMADEEVAHAFSHGFHPDHVE